MYTVERVKMDMDVEYTPDCSKTEAIKIAKEYAVKYPKSQIFISFFRANDGQRGYLNQDGSHDITGKAWVVTKVSAAAAAMGRVKSERKSKSSAVNGLKGGRPKKEKVGE